MGRCFLSAAAAGAPAGVVSAFAEPSGMVCSLRVSGAPCSGCLGGPNFSCVPGWGWCFRDADDCGATFCPPTPLQYMTLMPLHTHGCLGLNAALLWCWCLFTVHAHNARARTANGVGFRRFQCFCHRSRKMEGGGGSLSVHTTAYPTPCGRPLPPGEQVQGGAPTARQGSSPCTFQCLGWVCPKQRKISALQHQLLGRGLAHTFGKSIL